MSNWSPEFRTAFVVRGFRTPRTDDMRAMLEDLHAAGGPAPIEMGLIETFVRVAIEARKTREAMNLFLCGSLAECHAHAESES